MDRNRERDRDSDERKPSAYIGSIIGALIALWIVNSIPGWSWRFITSDFPAILWAANLSLGVQIAANALLVFLHPRFLHYFGQAVMNAAALLSLVITVTVFPFNFDAVFVPGDTIVRIVLIVACVGTGIALIVNALKTFGSFFRATAD